MFSADDIWTYMPYRSGVSGFDQYFELFLSYSETSANQAYAIFSKATGAIIGLSSFSNFDKEQRTICLDQFWITPDQRGGHIFAATANALLSKAFSLGVKRTEIRCHEDSKRANAALWKIGCKEEGTLRSAFLRADGTRIDIKVFSVLASDWNDVKKQLEYLCSR